MKREQGDWEKYRSLPGLVEIDFHWSDRIPDGGFHENMEHVRLTALDGIRDAFERQVPWLLLRHGSSTSRPGTITSRSQIRGLVKSPEVTPFIIRSQCIQHTSVMVVAIRPNKERRLRTAIHEAGHAVATIRLGHVHDIVTIQPDYDEGLNGSSGLESVTDFNRELAQEVVLISCAGYAALVASGYSQEIAKIGAERDFEEANELIDGFSLEPLEDWLRKSVELMSKPENKIAVERIASQLLIDETLEPDVTDALVELTDGNITEADYSRFLLMHNRHQNER